MRHPFRLPAVAVVALVCAAVSVPEALASFAGTDLFLPMVGRRPGIYPSDWYTKVWVHNPGPNPANVRFFYLERSASNLNPRSFDDTIPAGDTKMYENAVWTMFAREGFGAIRVLSLSGQKVIANSRVYSQAAGTGETDSLGQQFAGVPASFAIGMGEPAQVLGVHQTVPSGDSELRYNFGFVETTGNNATVRITVWSEDGQQLGSKDLSVREYSQRQVAFKDHFPAISTENARLTFEVVEGTGKIIAYGSGIANASQDPTTFEMSYGDELLGIATVQHDDTLTGDGTAAAPLGLADAAVTLEKLGTSNTPTMTTGTGGGGETHAAASTQILGTDGSDIFWTDLAAADGLTAGGVVFGGSSGELAQDTANLFWDDTNKRLGLGTATPNEQLELTGNLRLPETSSASAGVVFKGSSPFLHNSGATSTFLGVGAGNLTTTGAGNTGVGEKALSSNTNGGGNTALGRLALSSNTKGSSNTALGFYSLASNTTGIANTAVGDSSLSTVTTASYNTAVGVSSLAGNTSGNDNTAVGTSAMQLNTEGDFNTAVGRSSLYSNTTGESNTATGHSALLSNTEGTANVAVGAHALSSNTTGQQNTAVGARALENPTSASSNTAVGAFALQRNVTGENNTASGHSALQSNTTGANNVGLGSYALTANTTGTSNVAVGTQALVSNTEGSNNTAVGDSALYYNTTGSYNTALGRLVLLQNTTGDSNTGVGYHALQANTTGYSNVAVGRLALFSNSTGYHNTATGISALQSNTTGELNTAHGFFALRANIEGKHNSASGAEALKDNTTGDDNSAHGYSALSSNTGGNYNTAAGSYALHSNSTGSSNTAVGRRALQGNTTGENNTACGAAALASLTTGGDNLALGYMAGASLTTGTENVYVGSEGRNVENGTIRIGSPGTHTRAFLAGVATTSLVDSVPVHVLSDGQLGSVSPSSQRYKRDIHDMGSFSEALLRLRPVLFRYRSEIDPAGKQQHGLIAEEVAEVMPELVVYDADGRPEAVRYHELPTLLLNELQRQVQRGAEQEQQIDRLATRVAQLEALLQEVLATR